MNHDNYAGDSDESSLPIDRREYLKTTGILAAAALTSQGASGDTVADDGVNGTPEPLPAPENLGTDYESDPINLDPSASPRFTWEVTSTHRDRRQTAYSIRVASSEGSLKNGGDVWESGKVLSPVSINVEATEIDLNPDTTYYWSVRVWDEGDRPTPWSEPATFTTALPSGDEHWDGSWIGSPMPSNHDETHPAPLLRREVTFDRAVESARLHVSGLGFYDLHVNGEDVGDRVLDPGRTDYEETILYGTYDVGELLSAGDNAIGVELGRGRFGELVEDYWGWSEAPWWTDPQVLVQLNVEFVDGTTASVSTDESWSVTDGPTRFDSLYGGDTYDAREEKPGWATPSYDDSDWDDAAVAEPPGGDLTPQRVQPIEITDTYTPIEMNEPEDGVYVFDLGEQIAGWVELTVEGPAGTEITITQGESLNDGHVANDNSQLERPMQVDRYVLDGEGVETWEPAFSYKGFRYIQLDGFPGEPTLDSVEAKELHTAVETDVAGSFDSSDELLNWIHTNTREAMLLNFHSVHTDSPTWEKNGWTEHSMEMGPSANYNFWMPRFWRKYLEDCADAQSDNGNVPKVVPSPGYGYDDLDPGWGGSYVYNAWYAYRYHGDVRVLEDHYEGMKTYVDYVGDEIDGHIVRSGYGDWSSPAGPLPPEGPDIVSTSCYYRAAEIVADTAEFLGRDGDAAAYRELVDDIEAAFNEEFFDPETNIYRTGEADEYRQTSNVYPLRYGMVPDGQEDAVAANLAENVMETKDGHLNVGAHGLQYLLPVLTERGYHEAAMTVATQDTYPSWGWWKQNGAVSLLENWDMGTRSRTHDFLGSVDQWLFQYLAGIRAPDEPGFAEMTIKPHVPDDLEYASATTETVSGTVKSGWTKDGIRLEMDVTIPWNATAEVHVPARHPQSVTESGTPTLDAPTIEFDRVSDEHVVFNVGSGEYDLTSDPVRGSLGFARDTAKEALESSDLGGGPVDVQLEKLVGQTEDAIDVRDDGDNDADVEALVHKALITVNQLERRTGDDGSSLADTVAALDEELSRASKLLIDPDIGFAIDGSFVAGGTTRVTASITNGGEREVNDLDLSMRPPSGWMASPVGRTHTGVLKTGGSFEAAFNVSVPLDQPSGTGETEMSGTAAYRYHGGVAEVQITTSTTVVSPVRLAELSAQDVEPGERTTVEAVVENRIGRPVSGSVSVDLPNGWSTASDETSYRVDPDGSMTVPIEITAADDAERGTEVRITGSVTYPGGVGDRRTAGVYVPFGPLPDGFSEFANTEAKIGTADGEFVIDANGDNLWTDVDEFGSIYIEDGVGKQSTIVAKMSSMEDQRAFANKAGIVVKNDMTDPGSSTGYVALGLFPPGLSWLNWDSDDDGYLDDGSGWSELWPPCWLKIEKDGTTFTGYQSTDGQNWAEVGSTTIESAAEVQDAGMFSTSSTDGVLNRADFAEFDIR